MNQAIPSLKTPVDWGDTPIEEQNEPLLSLQTYTSSLRLVPQYVQMGVPYARSTLQVRTSVAHRLVHVSHNIPKPFTLVVWEAWRHPLTDEWLKTKWNVPAVPWQSGGVVSVSLADAGGRAIEMGSSFNEWSLQTPTRFFEEKLEKGEELSPVELGCLHNRRLLFHLMRDAGFVNDPRCWNQFHYGDAFWAAVTGEHAYYR